MRITPCESWPHRLESTRCRATQSASAGAQPAAAKMAAVAFSSGPAWMIIVILLPSCSGPSAPHDGRENMGLRRLVPAGIADRPAGAPRAAHASIACDDL